jgi:chemotaxis protein CheD
VVAAETMVRMGELAVSATAGDVLVSLGLGSCIGLALLDRRVGVAGLAHVVLPAAEGHNHGEAGKFADRAVPRLIEEIVALGGRRLRLEAVLAGGASMFAVRDTGPGVGSRNDTAVRDELRAQRIPVVAAATGGTRGRTIRVLVSTAEVTVREAGAKTAELLFGPTLPAGVR